MLTPAVHLAGRCKPAPCVIAAATELNEAIIVWKRNFGGNTNDFFIRVSNKPLVAILAPADRSAIVGDCTCSALSDVY